MYKYIELTSFLCFFFFFRFFFFRYTEVYMFSEMNHDIWLKQNNGTTALSSTIDKKILEAEIA